MRMSRRTLLNASAALAGALAVPGAARAAPQKEETDPCRLVDVFIGTGGHGHTYPGATLPFGMVQLGPDTDNARWDATSGYHYDDKTLMGFSHTHLSGTGIGDLLDVLVMPARGPVKLDPGPRDIAGQGYRARFDHRDEQARPGYYRVRLKESGIVAELTATARTGLHRYHFPSGGDAHLLIDFAHGMQDKPGLPARVHDASLRLVGDDTLVGRRSVDQWADGRVICFALKLSRPWRKAALYSEDNPLPADEAEVAGASLKAVLWPDLRDGQALLVKVGLSAVDIDGALRNLDQEQPGWDFDAVSGAAEQSWRRELSRIRVTGAHRADRTIFYTALYHSLLSPTLFSDGDGRYRGMDGAIHSLAPGEANYSTYSLWDTYRAQHPLFTLILGDRLPDILNSLIRMAEQSPAGLPVWPLQGKETACMIGHHSIVVLAEAAVKKVPGVDVRRVWPIARQLLFDSDDHGMAEYRRQGFIAADRVDESASRTLEYAYDDWAAAVLAEAAGAKDDAATLRQRSRNYRNLFDPATNFIRPRLADGSWALPFDPRALGHAKQWRDFTESNAWEATFLNQHDLYAYADLFGGLPAFEKKLDRLFSVSSKLPPDAPPDIAGLVGQYAHGNEPSHHVAYLYAYAGAPYKTQARVRMLLRTMHHAAPDGLAGNEDCGQMSAWYVMSALGLYAVDPVSGLYVFGSPLFDRAELAMGPGRTLIVESIGNGSANLYIQSVRWNGAAYHKSWISHADLAAGGHLVFAMGPEPNRTFGADPADRPPSFTVLRSA